MSDIFPNAPSVAEVRRLLHTIATLLRHSRQLGPEAQSLLAELIDELGVALESPLVPNEEIARLTEHAAQLMRAVSEKHDASMMEAAQERLEHAVVAIEARAPGLANLTRRLAEILSNLGI